MNTTAIKNYAIQARQDFRKLVTEKLHSLGVNADGSSVPTETVGDALVVNGMPFPISIQGEREQLLALVASQGFEHVVEAMAYTLFNRFCALRYMEVHDYLPQRAFTAKTGGDAPDLLANAIDAIGQLGLEPTKAAQLRDMKLRGDQDQELYKQLILAQCNALSKAMPFLFEPPNDMTELLMPDGLLHSDSMVRKLATSIPEEDWQEIEIIGWLYQFYISEKKDQVIGKVVKSEDIPAATQLFTPNWIVKYMVQNSLGAQWLATYPQSPLKGQMEYYIEPAEQTDEVKAQLAAITPGTLDPEALTLIDPASGSGHILVEAYELFKAIYLERGYRQRDVPQLVLTQNLFGLDIDERAAQLTGFALMMKGRADDRRLFERGVKLNVMALVDSAGFDAEGLAKGVELSDYGLKPGDLTEMKRLFEHATTFGSLIRVPEGLAAKLPRLKQLSQATSQDLFVSEALKRLGSLVQQADLLAGPYDAVVVNPPYMGNKGMNALVKSFTKALFPHAKNDLFACFIERAYGLAKRNARVAMVTMQSWMFLSSFESFREKLLAERTICSMAHLGARAFDSISGEVVQTTSFVLRIGPPRGFRPVFFRLLGGGEREKRGALAKAHHRFDGTVQDAFKKIPGSPLAYWVSTTVRDLFSDLPAVSEIAEAKQGLSTCNNDLFLRGWSEVNRASLGLGAADRGSASAMGATWFPYNKGGVNRRWFGNNDLVVNWLDEGAAIHRYNSVPLDYAGAPVRGKRFYFREGLTWSALSSGRFAVRSFGSGYIFADKGQCLFPAGSTLKPALGCFLNSRPASMMLDLLAPTLDYHCGYVAKLPFQVTESARVGAIFEFCVRMTQCDWNAYERSWDFESLPILAASAEPAPTLESSYTAWTTRNRETIAEMKRLEEENNRLFIDAYGLADELTPTVPLPQITLTANPAYRYGGKLAEEEQWTRFRQDTMAELVSYAIGCMMGRYSLDKPGLILANAGDTVENYVSKVGKTTGELTFPPDEDGIIPILADPYFEDDCTNRIVQFLTLTYGKETLNENLVFLADALGRKNSETPTEAIRRYLATKFFKDHLKTYKKRPIYWLVSSGKQRAFQALIYLHRYTPATLSRLRTSYLHELQNKLGTRIDDLTVASEEAATTAAKTRLTKQLATLHKQQAELIAFDEKLHHYADQRIDLDLDDGVKHNYGLFGDLLADVKAVTGGSGK
jgi:type II restriction/modification system DNA methylase subunit YeeA